MTFKFWHRATKRCQCKVFIKSYVLCVCVHLILYTHAHSTHKDERRKMTYLRRLLSRVPPPFQEYLGGLYLSKQLPTCLCSENKVVGIPLIGIDPKEIYGEFLYFFSCPLKSPHRPGRLSEIGAPDVREMPTAARNLTRNSFLCLSQNPRRPKRKIIKLNPTK